MGGKHLNAPIVGMAATPDGKGYWEVASDGGIFSFGDANFYGSTGGLRLNAPIVGMETTSDGKGYWLVASDGGIFNYGDAGFFGSTGSIRLHQPVVGMAATPDGGGYWMAARDGGVFSFGDAPFYGATPALDLAPVSAITATPDGKGYWEAATDGAVYPHGDAASFGANGMSLSEPVVGAALSILSSPSSSSVPQGSMAAPAGFSASDKVLDDQFANLDNWNTYYGPGTRWNNEGNLPSPYSGGNQPDSNDMAFYSPTQDVLMSGGGVSLEATPNNQFSSQGYSWASGVLTSKNPLPSGGWYVQVRAQMPDTSAGFWPAIWALPSSSRAGARRLRGRLARLEPEPAGPQRHLRLERPDPAGVVHPRRCQRLERLQHLRLPVHPGHGHALLLQRDPGLQLLGRPQHPELLPVPPAPGGVFGNVGLAHHRRLHARLHADRRGPGLLIVAVPVGQHRGGDRPTDQLPELAGGGSPPLALGAGT